MANIGLLCAYLVIPPNCEPFSMSQIHPVISRLCASIQGTSPARLADCLGLDSSKVIATFKGDVNSTLT